MDEEVAAFSRGPGGTLVELRGYMPREFADYLDAECRLRTELTKRETSRMDVVNDLIQQWVHEQAHRHSVFSRVIAGNPQVRNQGGGRGA